MKNKQLFYVILLVIAIIIFGIGFQVGKTTNRNSRFSNFNMSSKGLPGQMNSANNLLGEVIEKTDTNITIKLKNGSSKFAVISQETEVYKTIDVGISELNVGDTIMVSGQTTADGSILAESLRVMDKLQIRQNNLTPVTPK